VGKKKRRGREGITKAKGRDLYVARYTVETDQGPKRKAIYHQDYKELERQLNEALADRGKGLVFDAGAMTLADYMNKWLTDCAKARLAHRTYDAYEQRIRGHINPSIGRIKLAKLSPANVQAFYTAKLNSGLASGTVRAIYAVLSGALEQAVKWNLIPRNPASSVDPPKLWQDEITVLDADQGKAFLDAARGDRYECFFILALTCGLRRGEICGLRWSDINLDSRTLRVNRQLQRMRNGGGLYFTQPKNASRRTIKLPQRALESLRSHRKKQAEQRLLAGPNWRENGLVFTTLKGTPVDAQNFTARNFKSILKRAGLPDMPFHGLRHSCATTLLAKGTHPTYVQKLLGHSSIKQTLDIYSHFMPSMGDYTATAIDEALGEWHTQWHTDPR
jgi:integrase